MDIMYIDSMLILHIVYESTRFSAQPDCSPMSAPRTSRTPFCCWASIYTSLPNRILVDQGSNLNKGEIVVSLAVRANAKVQGTGIEAHSSVGIREWYHEPVRTTFRKIVLVYPNVDKVLLLQMAIKAMNDTQGPEGLVPSSLVFG